MAGRISPPRISCGICGALAPLNAITVVAGFTSLGALNFPVALAVAELPRGPGRVRR